VKNKSSQQRIAEAALKYAHNTTNGILHDSLLESIALGQVSVWVEQQDDCISPERIVFVAREACKLIRNHYRILASL